MSLGLPVTMGGERVHAPANKGQSGRISRILLSAKCGTGILPVVQTGWKPVPHDGRRSFI